MLLCVCPNPAVDVTYRLASSWVPGEVHRVSALSERAGGKAVNVARVARALGQSVTVLAPVGGASGDLVRCDLVAAGIPATLVDVAGSTRRTLAVVDPHTATLLNEPGPVLSASEWVRFVAAFSVLLPAARMVVASGSLPPGAPVDGYATLVRLAHARGVPIMVDAAGPALRAALAERPFLVKPNLPELVSVVGPLSPPPTTPPRTTRSEGAPPDTASRDVEPPDTARPYTAMPDTAPPDTASPDTASPDTAPPDTAPPGAAPPDTASPGAAPPDTASPGAAPPDTASPGAAPPDTASPGAAPPHTASPGAAPRDVTAVIAAARRLRDLGAENVVVSLGVSGLVAVTADGSWCAVPSEVLHGNATGAGDALVAALAVGVLTGESWPERLRSAVAWSAAAVASPLAGDVDRPTHDRLVRSSHVTGC